MPPQEASGLMLNGTKRKASRCRSRLQGFHGSPCHDHENIAGRAAFIGPAGIVMEARGESG